MRNDRCSGCHQMSVPVGDLPPEGICLQWVSLRGEGVSLQRGVCLPHVDRMTLLKTLPSFAVGDNDGTIKVNLSVYGKPSR